MINRIENHHKSISLFIIIVFFSRVFVAGAEECNSQNCWYIWTDSDHLFSENRLNQYINFPPVCERNPDPHIINQYTTTEDFLPLETWSNIPFMSDGQKREIKYLMCGGKFIPENSNSINIVSEQDWSSTQTKISENGSMTYIQSSMNEYNYDTNNICWYRDDNLEVHRVGGSIKNIENRYDQWHFDLITGLYTVNRSLHRVTTSDVNYGGTRHSTSTSLHRLNNLRRTDASDDCFVLHILDPDEERNDRTIHGISADGVTKVNILFLTHSPSEPVTFEISPVNEYGGERPGEISSQSLMPQPYEGNDDLYFVEAEYTAPDHFPGNHSFPIDIELKALQGGGTKSATLTLYQPPVITLHGLWSEGNVWARLKERMNSEYPAANVILGDYAQFNNISFREEITQQRIATIFHDARENLRKHDARKILANKFDVVAHSLGGLLILDWASRQNYQTESPSGEGWVRNLITVGTPIAGTNLANRIIIDAEKHPIFTNGFQIFSFYCRHIPPQLVTAPPVSWPVLVDLLDYCGFPVRCDSEECAVNSLTEGLLVSDNNGIHWGSIGTTAPGNSIVERIMNRIFVSYSNTTLEGLLGPEHDAIVPLFSQGLGAINQVTIHDILHASPFLGSSQTGSNQVHEMILCFIRGNRSCQYLINTFQIQNIDTDDEFSLWDEVFDVDFNNLSWIDSDYLSVLPSPNEDLIGGQFYDLSINALPGFNPIVFYILIEGEDLTKRIGNNAQMSIHAPLDNDSFNLKILALGDNNTYTIKNVDFNVGIDKGELFYLRTIPSRINSIEGGLTTIEAQAVYEKIKPITLTDDDVIIEIKPGGEAIVDVQSLNWIVGLQPGQTTLEIHYQDQTVSVPVDVAPKYSSMAIPVGTHTLSIIKSGNGTITSAPAGIDCGDTCAAEFMEGTSVTLSADPALGSSFTGWSGTCSGTGTCQLIMDQARSITATFTLVPPGQATLRNPAGSIDTNQPTYAWDAVGGADWYQLWVNGPSGTPVIQQWYTAAQAGCPTGSGGCAITPGTMLSPGPHRWWIRTWNEAGFGPWSAGLNFHVEPEHAPAAFIGAWPDDGTYVYDLAENRWTRTTSDALQLAAGDVNGDGRDDLIGAFPSGLWVRYSATEQWVRLSTTPPDNLAVADLTDNGQQDVLGSWSSGLYYRDSETGQWTRLATPAQQLAAGDLDGDGRDDLLGVWGSELWQRGGASGAWTRIPASRPEAIAVGDMTGSGWAEVIGSWSSGVYYRDAAGGRWIRLAATPAELLSSGDLSGDGRDELIGVWPDGVWVLYLATNQWQRLTSSKPVAIATGRLFAEMAEALADPLSTGEAFIDASRDAPDRR